MKLSDQEQVILKAIGHGVAEISRVIKAVGYPKATVKKVLVRLSEKGIVALHRHDWPQSLAPAQRKLMVRLGSNYYNAVSMRKRNPKSKGKKALKTTGRALKGFARGALSAGAQILGAGAAALNPHGMSEKAWKAEERKYRKSIAAYRAKGWTFQQIKDRLWLTYGLTLSKLEGSQAVFVDPFRLGGGFTLDLNEPKRGRKANPKRRKSNADHKDSDHPVEVTKHWRSGPPGYLTPWQRAHHAGQHDLFAHGIKPAKKRNTAIKELKQYEWKERGYQQWLSKPFKSKKQAVEFASSKPGDVAVSKYIIDGKPAGWTVVFRNPSKKKASKRNASRTISAVKTAKRRSAASRQTGRKAKKTSVRSVVKTRKGSTKRVAKRAVKKSSRVLKGKRNPSAESIRKTFAGSVSGERELFFPQGTPSGKLAKLGRLVSITTKAGTIKPISGTAWLCADTKGKLHIGSTKQAPLIDGPARNFGEVTKLEYEGSKPHLGYRGPIIWFHRVGEENQIRPTLRADGKGGLVFRGGDYRITERGIEN